MSTGVESFRVVRNEEETTGVIRPEGEQSERAVPGPMEQPNETHERPKSEDGKDGVTEVEPSQSRRQPDRPQSLPTRSRRAIEPEAGSNAGPASSSQQARQTESQAGPESDFEESGPPTGRAQGPSEGAQAEVPGRPHRARPETEPGRPAVQTDATTWWPFGGEFAGNRPHPVRFEERPASESTGNSAEPWQGQPQGYQAHGKDRPTFEAWTRSMHEEEERTASRAWAEEIGRRRTEDAEAAARVQKWARGYDPHETVERPNSEHGEDDREGEAAGPLRSAPAEYRSRRKPASSVGASSACSEGSQRSTESTRERTRQRTLELEVQLASIRLQAQEHAAREREVARQQEAAERRARVDDDTLATTRRQATRSKAVLRLPTPQVSSRRRASTTTASEVRAGRRSSSRPIRP